MRLEVLKNVEYATALKQALTERRAGTIDGPTDTQLGILCHNIAAWGIADMLAGGHLQREHVRDEDFRSEITLQVVRKIDSVSLDREPKEILVYLYRVARNAVHDYTKKMGRAKRQHVDVDLERVTMESDFYGNPVGRPVYDNDVNEI